MSDPRRKDMAKALRNWPKWALVTLAVAALPIHIVYHVVRHLSEGLVEALNDWYYTIRLTSSFHDQEPPR